MELGEGQQRALDAVSSGRNVFFSGVTGTGARPVVHAQLIDATTVACSSGQAQTTDIPSVSSRLPAQNPSLAYTFHRPCRFGSPGKSHVIARIRESLSARGKRFGLTAPTGAASINIGGETLHAFAGCSLPTYADDFIKMWGGGRNSPNAAKWRELDALIIDEIRRLTAAS